MEKTLVTAITLLVLTLGRNIAEEPDRGKDRFDKYIVIKAVPHERLRIWPIGDKTGMELLVKRGTTDEQLAKLVAWYVSQANATSIVIFDMPGTPPGGGANAVMANYDGHSGGKLTRFLYRHGDLVGERRIELPPQKGN